MDSSLTTGSNPVLLPPTKTKYTIRKVQTRLQTKQAEPTTNVIIETEDDTEGKVQSVGHPSSLS